MKRGRVKKISPSAADERNRREGRVRHSRQTFEEQVIREGGDSSDGDGGGGGGQGGGVVGIGEARFHKP